jgi:flagellar basal-body rod protein FlgF
MDQISVLAASGMRASMQSLDLLANNIANASTGGYKGDSEFHTVFVSEAANEDLSATPATLPVIQRAWTDFSQGLLEPTNNPLDLGLQGKGFFVVQGASGPLYTRDGSLHLSADGTLVTADGYPVMQKGGLTIQAQPNQPIEISTDGGVRQAGQLLGQLQLVEFEDPSTLTKYGNNYFQNAGSLDPANGMNTQVYQGKVEGSNVSASHGAVRLVSVMRQFEMMQKAISISNDMGRMAIEQVAKL